MNKLLFFMGALLLASTGHAQETVAAAAESSHAWAYALGAALGVGLAAFGCGLAQGKVGAAAMDGLARNPQARDAMFVPMILALVFIETLVIFTFALSFLVQTNI